MSVYDLLTPLSVGKHYLDINVNSIQVGEGNSSFQGPTTFQSSITVNDDSSSGNPIILVKEISPIANQSNIMMKLSNQSGSETLTLTTKNDPNPTTSIITGGSGPMFLTTSSAASSINLYPNFNQALVCSYISPGVTQTLIQNLQLPTVGGTPANLNYYEEYTAPFGFTGPWGGPTVYTRNINIVKIGRMVILKIDSIVQPQNTPALISMIGSIPTRFIPTISSDSTISDIPVTLIDNGGLVSGNLEISNLGGIQMYFMKYTGVAPFTYVNSTGLGNCGFNELFVSYLI